MFDYRQISTNIVSKLPDRTRDIISRRFGLNQESKKESLEAIGVDYGITRERVRQIEQDAIKKMQRGAEEEYQPVFDVFREQMISFGGIKKEDEYIKSLGKLEDYNYISFLLSLNNSFYRSSESKDIYSFWAIDQNSFNNAQETIKRIHQILSESRKPIKIEHCINIAPVKASKKVNSYLDLSKKIHLTPDGVIGFKNWPEINPRGTKDKAYLLLRKKGKALHFREIAKLLGNHSEQTVHNELIKDERFVLVGRGIYALKEWGYEPGDVKDVIKKILLIEGKPMTKEEITARVLEKRIVKKNTIIQNLCNKDYFERTSDGKYLAK
ncbi:MAG TPA: sigma factor-like helix-turn-helix DNA-binding protein [Candidatus Pacearchaeota archaeon]|nr:sigma factor-like helix-turn-helix DNA-binding protein [Candidatus Pacearchaeota archaeon]